MATLNVSELADGALPGLQVPLRRWLDGRWAILFSHPDDFVQCELELDRWVGILGDAFARARVRPLALSRRTCPIDRGWVSQLSGEACVVSLREPAHGPFDLHARRLQAAIEGLGQRFAMIIDSTLRRQRTFTYETAERLPSPLDLLRLACRLRNEQTPEQRPAAQCAPPCLAAPPNRLYGSYAFA
jgi:alkyl hydroperoxide reductase subunit AhpC